MKALNGECMDHNKSVTIHFSERKHQTNTLRGMVTEQDHLLVWTDYGSCCISEACWVYTDLYRRSRVMLRAHVELAQSAGWGIILLLGIRSGKRWTGGIGHWLSASFLNANYKKKNVHCHGNRELTREQC